MKLGEILRPDMVKLDFTAGDKASAVRALVDFCIERGSIPANKKQKVIDALEAREKIATTGLDNGVALPHATVDVLEEPAVAVALSRAGVPFESTDGNPARILILLVIPRRGIQKHVRTLAAIARLVESAAMRDALCGATSAEQVLEIIRREESA